MLLLMTGAAALRMAPLTARLSPGVRPAPAVRPAHPHPVQSRFRPLTMDARDESAEGRADDEELDAADTVDSWDAQLAEQAAWLAAQKAAKAPSAPPPPAEWDGAVDEDAHFGLDADDDEEPSAAAARQLLEKQAALMLRGIEAQASASAPPSKAVLNSLEAVLNALTRLDERMRRLEAKVDGMRADLATGASAAMTMDTGTPDDSDQPDDLDAADAPDTSGAGPSSPAAGGAGAGAGAASSSWDGTVDEMAYFDDDMDDDMPDWRDVRRLNSLLKKDAEKEVKEADAEGEGGSEEEE
jgi:hypothetical protein